MKYINVVIDNKSDSTDNFYTYGCEDDSIGVGSKVYVPFARSRKLREGYVMSFAESVDDELKKKLKYVQEIDEDVRLSEETIRTCVWMKQRYICRYIDVINCFTPVGSKAKRRTVKDPFDSTTGRIDDIKELTAQQMAALYEIEKAVKQNEHKRFLLHGVTGSGKTEIYIRAAEKAVSCGKTAIILVPEIALTTQIIDRFIGRFGRERIAVLHSKLSAGERYDQWKKICDGDVDIVIGARLAVFAPLKNIGLIVMDEEHESTYKSDHTPKYDTAEVALKRVQDKDNNGVLILGSATPSVVTYSRGEEGIYRILRLTERYNKVQMPEVVITDMRQELKNGNRSIISGELHRQMKQQLEDGKQVMLFLNRRGYSTFISCRECGYVAKCPTCGLSMTYHRASDRLTCHYCGYDMSLVDKCPDCGSKYVKYFGNGTEKLEETIAELFPEYTCDRLDLDSVKQKGELTRKLKAFEKGKTRILIGTQLIAKGLDFRNVGLVGIIAADISLNIPDFRSSERTFQLITQAAGRAGRGDEKGRVVIQSYNPDHYAIQYAAAQDYEGFYNEEKIIRGFMSYPPYSDLFQIIFTAESEAAAAAGAGSWYDRLMLLMHEDDRSNVFRPQEAYMSKIKDTYRYSILIKCPKGKRIEYSNYIALIKEQDRKNRSKNFTAVVDINPYSFT